jgi:putative SOS response-associated peptidase YedK
MIERYTITASHEQLHQRFGVEVPEFYAPHYNAAPTHLLPIILQGSVGISFFYWGIPPNWAKNKNVSEKLVNIRAESFSERPAMQKVLKKHRCILPADGFYSWKKVGKKTLIPYRFTQRDKSVFSIAGIWEEFEDNENETHHTFMLITVEANAIVNAVSERMPAMLDKTQETIWMNHDSSEEELLHVLKPYDESKLSLYTVSPRINDSRVDVPSLIIATPPADQFGNLTLFD